MAMAFPGTRRRTKIETQPEASTPPPLPRDPLAEAERIAAEANAQAELTAQERAGVEQHLGVVTRRHLAATAEIAALEREREALRTAIADESQLAELGLPSSSMTEQTQRLAAVDARLTELTSLGGQYRDVRDDLQRRTEALVTAEQESRDRAANARRDAFLKEREWLITEARRARVQFLRCALACGRLNGLAQAKRAHEGPLSPTDIPAIERQDIEVAGEMTDVLLHRVGRGFVTDLSWLDKLAAQLDADAQ